MGALVTLLVGVVAVAVAVAVLGLVVGLITGLLALAMKLLPILLIGYVVVKLVRRTERPRPALTASERSWLDTPS